mgnify:CR=1 FL=1
MGDLDARDTGAGLPPLQRDFIAHPGVGEAHLAAPRVAYDRINEHLGDEANLLGTTRLRLAE